MFRDPYLKDIFIYIFVIDETLFCVGNTIKKFCDYITQIVFRSWDDQYLLDCIFMFFI